MPNDADFDDPYPTRASSFKFDLGLQQVHSASSSLIEVYNCGMKDHGGRTTSC
ncbi:hypothetical protein L208DRAFT_1418979 [Tricholoma matsutake]|nr:hypothetical protein L208DRAFT_1418979 [Tricholoma matsutake 945]